MHKAVFSEYAAPGPSTIPSFLTVETDFNPSLLVWRRRPFVPVTHLSKVVLETHDLCSIHFGQEEENILATARVINNQPQGYHILQQRAITSLRGEEFSVVHDQFQLRIISQLIAKEAGKHLVACLRVWRTRAIDGDLQPRMRQSPSPSTMS